MKTITYLTIITLILALLELVKPWNLRGDTLVFFIWLTSGMAAILLVMYQAMSEIDK